MLNNSILLVFYPSPIRRWTVILTCESHLLQGCETFRKLVHPDLQFCWLSCVALRVPLYLLQSGCHSGVRSTVQAITLCQDHYTNLLCTLAISSLPRLFLGGCYHLHLSSPWWCYAPGVFRSISWFPDEVALGWKNSPSVSCRILQKGIAVCLFIHRFVLLTDVSSNFVQIFIFILSSLWLINSSTIHDLYFESFRFGNLFFDSFIARYAKGDSFSSSNESKNVDMISAVPSESHFGQSMRSTFSPFCRFSWNRSVNLTITGFWSLPQSALGSTYASKFEFSFWNFTMTIYEISADANRTLSCPLFPYGFLKHRVA